MKIIHSTFFSRLFFAALLMITVQGSLRADDHTYQVTGPILSITPTSVVVQKGTDKWEISFDAGTKGNTGLKVGDKITIKYHMVADKIDVKPAK